MKKYQFFREQRPSTNVLYQEFSFQDNEVQNEIEEVPEITGKNTNDCINYIILILIMIFSICIS